MSWETAEEQQKQILLFGKYAYNTVSVADETLQPFINLSKQLNVPHSGAKYACKPFGKSEVSIIERLTCYLMRKGRNNGKKQLAMRHIRNAFNLMELMTGENPIQIFVDAIVNCGPREESARVGRGGAAKRTSVDVSPIRRVNVALYYLTTGIRKKSFKGTKTLAEIMADEFINAAKNSPNSFSIKKREETEKVAKSNR